MDRDKFDAMVNRFLLFAAKVPEIEAYVATHYPEGSYERIAFAKFKEVVPVMDYFAAKLIDAPIGVVDVSTEEHLRLKKVILAIKDAQAVLQETNMDVEFY